MTVTWGQAAVVVGALAFVGLAVFVGLAFVVRHAVHSHLLAVQKQVAQVVALADAADTQYRATKTRIDAVEKVAERAHARIDGLTGEVGLVMQRLGLSRSGVPLE